MEALLERELDNLLQQLGLRHPWLFYRIRWDTKKQLWFIIWDAEPLPGLNGFVDPEQALLAADGLNASSKNDRKELQGADAEFQAFMLRNWYPEPLWWRPALVPHPAPKRGAQLRLQPAVRVLSA